MFKRLLFLMVMLFSLAACGIGGSSATVTPPPTNTPAATATPRPTATSAPTATTEASTGGEEGTIPAPPNSSPYVKGEDPIVDAAIEGMEKEFQNQIATSGLDLQPLNYYVSEDTAENITAFYDQEMPSYGWDAGQTQDEDFGKIQIFTAGASTAALIGVLDLSKAAPSLKGLIVFTTVAKQGSGSGGSVSPTDTPAAGGSTGGSTEQIDIPLPPNATAYTEGSDPTLDLMVKTFNDSFKNSAGDSTTVVGQTAFTFKGAFADVKKFYNDTLEESDSNWQEVSTGTSGAVSGQELATFSNLDSGGQTKILVVTSLDLKAMGVGEDMLVFVIASESK